MQLTPYQLKTAQSFMDTTPVICHDPKTEFINALQAYGFGIPRQLKIGEIGRIDSPNDRKGQGSGWYVYYEIEDTTEDGYLIGIATFGDWKSDIKEKWSSRSDRQMSDKELTNYRQKMEVMRAQHEEEQRRKHTEAAAKAYTIWSNAPDATNDHPYLKDKGVITCEGVKLTPDNELLIPAQIENKITTLQSIKPWGEYENAEGEPIGNKRFMAGGRSKGAYFPIRGKSDVIYIAEGYSTGMSIHMATEKMVYVCFNCHNIYNVTAFAKEQHEDAQIIIAGDDDFNNDINSGRKYAEEAARAHNAMAIFPEGINDFNDMHIQHGLEAVKKTLLSDGRARKHVVEKKKKGQIERPAGVLGHIFDYYNATSGIEQQGFAVQTSLAICATILGRKFRTNMKNYPSLYFINVGKSGTGKEHAKTTLEKVLDTTGFSQYICGDGFTSAGAVYSILLGSPIATTCIDEFGRYLEASAAGSKGNTNQREANTKIMEAFGRTNSVLRPPNYSTMTLTKEAQREMKSRFVHNPALTILGMTTPSTLFKTLTMDAIKDGFVNRFVIYISDVERSIRYFGQEIEVPAPISEWAEKIRHRSDIIHLANEPAEPIILKFTDAAMDKVNEFQQYANVDLPNSLDKYGMPEVSGRSNEIAMKIALIYALSRDPMATEVGVKDVNWAIEYVKICLHQTIDALKMTISSSDFESHKKEILADIRKREGGITWSQMQRTPPYSQHNPKYLKELMNSLRDAELVDFEASNPEGRGRPTTLWFAT